MIGTSLVVCSYDLVLKSFVLQVALSTLSNQPHYFASYNQMHSWSPK